MTPSEKYQDLISRGALENDLAQQDVLKALDTLYTATEDYQPKSRWHLSGLFGVSAPKPKGLYIYGAVGRGKSMLMDLFFDCAKVAKKRRVHFHAFMQEVQNALHRVRQTGAVDALKPVAQELIESTSLLCFDEMHITDIADAMIVGRLFDLLFDGGVIIVATANPPPRDLYKGGLNRAAFIPFIELIEQNLTLYNLDGDSDYRLSKLRGQKRYFYPNNKKSHEQITTLWHDITGGAHGAGSAHGEPLTLKRKGRAFVVPYFNNGCGWGSFAELCETPLGAGDYLLIAKTLRALFITDIPILGKENDSAAKRFITMIDTLYEAKVSVIASAAAKPNELYKGTKLAFEFERTASRLFEMDSADWSHDS